MSSRDCSGVHELLWNNHLPIESPQHIMNLRDLNENHAKEKKGSPFPKTECATQNSHWNLSMGVFYVRWEHF